MALTQDSLEIIRLLCDVTLRMIEGELYQLTKTGDVDITEDEHFEIIRRKTAFLFGGCAQIGGMLGGVTPEQERRCATTASTSASPSSWSTTCSTTPPTRPLSASRSAATCAKARSPCPSSSCCSRGGEAADTPDPRHRARPRRYAEQWREILRLMREHRATEQAYEPRPRVRRPRQGLPGGVPAEPRTRRAHGAARLRAARATARRRSSPVAARTRSCHTMPAAPQPAPAAVTSMARCPAHCSSRRLRPSPPLTVSAAPMDPRPASTAARRDPPPRGSLLHRQRPEITDDAFDALVKELEALEAEHPDLVTTDSRRSASAAARSKGSRPPSICSRCSASTTATPRRSCGRSMSACARGAGTGDDPSTTSPS